jgi:glutaredoxin-like protein NrdH
MFVPQDRQSSRKEPAMATSVHVDGRPNPKILLYTLSTCIWCRKTKALLQELGVAYDYIDVDKLVGEERNAAIKAIEKWNPDSSFPTMVINDAHPILGFQELLIRKTVEKSK